ncbi:Pyruvate decarboxylase [Penicillium digitatum]|uniref:Pyruvate decarboxylase n=3 Tax=Penicillium digitatum TaxID=36651 RepID=K9FCX3_PEND2|nr:Pyruvate decarboxylase [Penicillium digitatum Pd1]EKV05967.1 Pyruvate decarboxylase [Penicillium digitatum PHI26]EKV17735.1 Pyruvate decarboxylase [Penicillium digitatum Pd1]QQK46906.1 Pyruvate decarboxylase [Penicillium digitatum]
MATTDIATRELENPMDVAEYLFRRLHEVGIRSVHGLPGDYNLAALDYLPKCELNWVGNCNELNAGYAADGYARVNGISALVTTFGVGELSALNAIAGSYSEFVPVIHIVGQPTTQSQKDGMLLHHTLGNGDFDVFTKMSAGISCYVARLNDPKDAATLIDSAIRECWIRSRPVYITLPTDLVAAKVNGDRLKTPIDLSLPKNDPEKEDYVVDVVLKYLHAAKNPVILVDACAIRHRALEEVRELVEKSGLPTFVTPMGKGAVNEDHKNFGGVYAGNGSNPGVSEAVESSDLILSVGAIKSDFNTTGFTYRVGQLNTIDFHSTFVRVRYSEYPDINMKGVLRKVVERMNPLTPAPIPLITNRLPESEQSSTDQTITHKWLWPIVGQWLRAKDIVLTETGTANFGIWDTRFPANVTAISQVLWGSIGFAMGACQGAALAAKEQKDRRTILFIGDGSIQLTVQELSTILKNKLNPIVFVICNDGYTIERYIHGWDAVYNDIQPWEFVNIPKVFGAKDNYQGYRIKTRDELNQLFADEDFNVSDKLRLVELYMPRDDAPAALKLTAEAAAQRNSGK